MAARPATLGDKLILIPHVFIGLGVGLARLATRPITNDVKPPTAFKDFVYATFRHVLSQVTVTQEKWLTVPTEKTYLDWAAKKSLETDTVVLASGLKVHWVGKPSSEKVFLYFHGGGYVNPITPQHLDWLLELQTDLSKTKSVAVAVVGYTCSPEGQYPVQLREGAESLLWLLNAQGKKPEDILIGGDSAGANMALGLLSHILHPHPNFEDKLQVKLSGPLAGAILTSPWVKFPTDDESATRNAGSDFVCKAAAVRWADAFLGSAPYDNYTQPLLAAKDWFSDLEKVVKGIIVWGGEQEVLIDSIDAIAQKLQDSFPGTEYVRSPGGAHVGWLSHKIIGIEGKEESTQAIEGWMAARL